MRYCPCRRDRRRSPDSRSAVRGRAPLPARRTNPAGGVAPCTAPTRGSNNSPPHDRASPARWRRPDRSARSRDGSPHGCTVAGRAASRPVDARARRVPRGRLRMSGDRGCRRRRRRSPPAGAAPGRDRPERIRQRSRRRSGQVDVVIRSVGRASHHFATAPRARADRVGSEPGAHADRCRAGGRPPLGRTAPTPCRSHRQVGFASRHHESAANLPHHSAQPNRPDDHRRPTRATSSGKGEVSCSDG